MKTFKGQGALEYLLLIGGAILITAIVIAVLTSLGSNSKETINKASQTENSAMYNLKVLAATPWPVEWQISPPNDADPVSYYSNPAGLLAYAPTTWSDVSEPFPMSWKISGESCDGSKRYHVWLKGRVFIDRASNEGKRIVLRGDSPCGKDGFKINDNIFVFLNGKLQIYSGTPFGPVNPNICLQSFGPLALPNQVQQNIPSPPAPAWISVGFEFQDSPDIIWDDWNEFLIALEDHCGGGGIEKIDFVALD